MFRRCAHSNSWLVCNEPLKKWCILLERLHIHSYNFTAQCCCSTARCAHNSWLVWNEPLKKWCILFERLHIHSYNLTAQCCYFTVYYMDYAALGLEPEITCGDRVYCVLQGFNSLSCPCLFCQKMAARARRIYRSSRDRRTNLRTSARRARPAYCRV